jgi:hypothetical protein
MMLVTEKKRPSDAFAEWPDGWHTILAECVEVQVPSGKVSLNKNLVMQVGKRKPLVYSEARKAGLLLEVSEGFWKKLAKRFKKK